MTSAKSFEISKWTVWEAYKRVKANRGAAGVDGESIAAFDQHLNRNLYALWNRMSSGSYHPPAVRRVEIPKKCGGKRSLGVPTVSDRIAQMVVKMVMEPKVEPVFHPDSYGYRPGRSARAAVAVTRQRCWRYGWVVEFDIRGAFDNIDHELLMKSVEHHVSERWVVLYIKRWLTAPFELPDGQRVPRDRGVPQGGVISPLLMNLFMHYAFDYWMQRTYPHSPFARYADDAVVHCRSQSEAESLLVAIGQRLQDCRLALHSDKSKVVYCKDSNRRQTYAQTQFTFLGFTFRPREAVNRQGKRFTGFLPAVSADALKGMRERIKSWNFNGLTFVDLNWLARRYDPVLRGWWNYYGSFYPTEMLKLRNYLDLRLMGWVRRKFKSLRHSRSASADWLSHICRQQPQLFCHWRFHGANDRIMGAV